MRDEVEYGGVKESKIEGGQRRASKEEPARVRIYS